MGNTDVKPSVFAPRRGGRRGGFPKGAALKSAPETPQNRAKYSLSRREARPDLYGARAPRAPVFAAVRGRGPKWEKGPSWHPPAGVRGTGTPTWDQAKSVSELETGDRRFKKGFAQ